MATTASAVPKKKIAGGSFLLEEGKIEEVFTPEDFSEQHLLIAQTAEEFAINEIVPAEDKIESEGLGDSPRPAQEGERPGADFC